MAKLLVTGVTESIGSEVAASLLDMDIDFKVMVSSEADAKAFEEKGVPTVVGDFRYPASLEKALEGIDRAFLVTPAHQDMVEYEKNFIDAAKKQDVKHIIKVSAIGASPDASNVVGRYHAETEQYLEESGIDYTILRSAYLMTNQLANISEIQQQGNVYSMSSGRIPMLDTRDLGEIGAKILQRGGHEGKIYHLTGKEAISFRDVAEIVSEATGKQIDYVNVEPGAAEDTLVSLGFPQWLAADMVELNRMWERGEGIEVDTSSERLLDRPPRGYREFVEDHLALMEEEDVEERPGDTGRATGG